MHEGAQARDCFERGSFEDQLVCFEHGSEELLEPLDLRSLASLHLRCLQSSIDVTPDIVELVGAQDVVLESRRVLNPLYDDT